VCDSKAGIEITLVYIMLTATRLCQKEWKPLSVRTNKASGSAWPVPNPSYHCGCILQFRLCGNICEGILTTQVSLPSPSLEIPGFRLLGIRLFYLLTDFIRAYLNKRWPSPQHRNPDRGDGTMLRVMWKTSMVSESETFGTSRRMPRSCKSELSWRSRR